MDASVVACDLWAFLYLQLLASNRRQRLQPGNKYTDIVKLASGGYSDI